MRLQNKTNKIGNQLAITDISLALSGGGVKCYAHIGVLRVLERVGICVHGIAGTSAGGIIATLYAAGYTPDEIQKFFEGLNLRQLLRRSRREGPGLFGLKRAKDFFHKMLEDRTFADLKIPLALTSVDLKTGWSTTLTEGPLLEALMIAVAIPGLFPPGQHQGNLLIDGGVLHPVPVSAVRSIAPEFPVVAVAIFPPYEEWDRHPFPNILQSVPLLQHFAHLRLVESFNIYVRAMDLSQRMLAELRLEVDKPKMIIRPEVNHLGLFDPVDVENVIRAGETAAEVCFSVNLHNAVEINQTNMNRPDLNTPHPNSNNVP